MSKRFGKFAAVLALSLPLALAACGEDENQTAGEKLDEATQSANQAAEDVKDAANDAADAAQQKLDNASDAVNKAVDDVQNDLSGSSTSN